jgi:hypothetical protein
MSGHEDGELGWASHSSRCARCRKVDLQHTATVANACLTGARLLKEALSSLQRRKVDAAIRRELGAAIDTSADLTRQALDKARAP